MSKIKMKMEFQRMATIKTSKGQSPVGTVEDFKQNADGSLEFTVKLDPSLPAAVREAIEKNPAMLGLTGIPKVVDPIIIPEPGDEPVKKV